MNIQDLNNKLDQLAQSQSRDNVIEFAYTLLDWIGIEPTTNKTPQLLAPKTQKLKDYLLPAPQTVQPQLYRLNAENQNIRVRFAVLKKIKKDYISQLVDNDPGAESFQNTPDAIKAITKAPYFLHFVTTPEFNKLVLVFNNGEQKRILNFRNKLTNTQYNKIIQQWAGIASKSKAEITDIFWKSLDIKEVNKEFYKQVKERFDALVGIAKAAKVNASENQVKQFAVRLIGRYIFCWFLKEKGIIPLRLICSSTIKKEANYFHRFLLKLFFNTLNTKVQERPVILGNNGELENEKLFEKIPYLNGGLFDENEEDRLFCNLELDDWLIPFVEVLENYDFTVDESSGNYQQIAVDPEMLGRIFENLLASQNEETEKIANQRKAFGAFYTPREIVDYMVNESIKAYLQTSWEKHIEQTKTEQLNNPEPIGDIFGNKPNVQLKIPVKTYQLKEEEKQKIEKALAPLFASQPNADGLKKEDKILLDKFLSEIKILDPACGSGAFPMGVLLKLKELREMLGFYPSAYQLKLNILSNNIYGVDIMPMATEIARLRSWLSLVLDSDYKPEARNNNFGIDALPNLDFKFVCANSLIDLGLDAFIQESKGTFREEFTRKLVIQLKELEDLRKQFFLPDVDQSDKVNLKKQYLQRRDKVIKNIEADSEPVLKIIAEKIKNWNPFDDSFTSPFFSPTWMFGIDKGFDVVIGNPPYGGTYTQTQKKYFSQNYVTAKTISGVQKGSLDTYSLFIEKGFVNLHKGGNLIYIVPISITSSDSLTGVHRLIEKNCEEIKISSYSVRPQPVFENAVVNTSIIFFKKTNTPAQKIYSTKMYRKNIDYDIRNLVNNLQFIDVLNYTLNGRYPKISLPIEINILNKIFAQSKSIGEILKKEGSPIFYRTTGGRYFKVITNYSTGSTKERAIYFDKVIANSIGAILSSNLFFWFYQIYSNNLDLKSYEIESFRIPYEKLTVKKIKEIDLLYDKYQKEIELNSHIRQTEKYANIDSFKEYKISKSKKIIDYIDDVICPLYGLTDEDIDFIKNYEIQFRLSDEDI